MADLQSIIKANVSPDAKLMTDELQAYKVIGRDFASRESVAYSKDEYVRGDVQ